MKKATNITDINKSVEEKKLYIFSLERELKTKEKYFLLNQKKQKIKERVLRNIAKKKKSISIQDSSKMSFENMQTYRSVCLEEIIGLYEYILLL